MDADTFASSLGGEYPFDLTREQEAVAKEHGLVVVFGASDDLMEFRGAVHDEIDAYNGATAYLTSDGLLHNDCDSDDCPHFERLKKRAVTIDALWCPRDDISWTYRTSIPHATFTISDDGDTYCEGIVFALAALSQEPQ